MPKHQNAGSFCLCGRLDPYWFHRAWSRLILTCLGAEVMKSSYVLFGVLVTVVSSAADRLLTL